MGNNEEDIPERGSVVGASACQALWRAPGHQAQLASSEIWWRRLIGRYERCRE